MKKIGFVGLGTMGAPMASHLLKADYEIIVYNRTKEKADELIAKGAVFANSPADVARQSEVVFTMLTADSAVEQVVLGANGILEGANEGLIVVDSSTISPKTSKKLAAELAKKGVEMLDAPVTGSEPQAIEGVLTFMVGGKSEVYEKCAPLFEIMGKASFHMGENGAGSYMKLANNTLAAINLLSLSESLIMATKSGIDPELFVKVVSGGGARSGMVDNKTGKIISRDFRPHFATALMHKDLTLATDLAAELKLPVPVLSLVRQMLQMAISNGFGNEDMCSVIKCYEEWAEIEVTSK
ncbi:NAD(P)-dependent oxidoreductase [Ammoniphilus resinae]|uniref:3-hydroxyisobutyrate dehydrogenase-like beta-hydroxyacid dehydrogenase n=1 Tax=Ammoniphilus resinae TaxID=861532 RepID=A0ABS4GLT0_9BACL|nr:NAD(P)-dependent oxidoreductase [Ammoniphilus resinae]MBP1931223.1 3-hydroxyisobutyrate dehydrogenase-like beta-hydroxyacid dehydrogenase [Ammoniphilus resinae]